MVLGMKYSFRAINSARLLLHSKSRMNLNNYLFHTSSPSRFIGTGPHSEPKSSNTLLTLSRRSVVLPCSNSRTKRNPTPAFSERSTCVSLYFLLLLSGKLQNATISLSAMPINRRCGLLFRKSKPPFPTIIHWLSAKKTLAKNRKRRTLDEVR